jgi:hypothetical protein
MGMPGRRTDGFVVPRSDRFDLEVEVRRRLRSSSSSSSSVSSNGAVADDEADIDSKLYTWWLKGGWWGAVDTSGDYTPPTHQDPDTGVDDPDWDATSIISTTETSVDDEYAWESDNGDDSLNDGQRTPTQRSPNPFAGMAPSMARGSRASSPAVVDTPLAMNDLARLLHPQSPQEREEARTLAAHLGSKGIMTRSRFQRQQQQQRAQVVLGNRHFVSAAANHHTLYPEPPLTADEEARRLEEILLWRRAASQEQQGDAESWATGAAGLGPDGPQCVVCQSAPRTVIVWPCRCLSLCDDCRVSLAMNNFDKCVCCRREVISFSRIYVP